MEESKSAAEHIALFSSILSQVQDSGLHACDDKLKDVFLLKTLLDSWKTLVVSLSNKANLTFEMCKRFYPYEEIKRRVSGECGGSTNMIKNTNVGQRNKSKNITT